MRPILKKADSKVVILNMEFINFQKFNRNNEATEISKKEYESNKIFFDE